MNIILKFVLTSILEKKFRTFLIVFAVLISTALFFASSAIPTTMEAMLLEQMEKYTGNADILISRREDAPSRYFNPQVIAPWAQELEYSAGTLGVHGFHQDQGMWLQIQGVTWAEVARWNPVSLLDDYEFMPFLGEKIVLSQATVEELGLSLGDKVELEINGAPQEFILSGIAKPQGPFMEDGRSTFAMVPRRTLAGIIGESGMVSAMYLKVSDPSQVQQLISQMEQELTGFNIMKAGLDDQAQMALDSLVMPFLLITVIISMFSAYIIFTSFRLIIAERLPVIGTFRSIGATKARTNMVLIMEGLVYGILGGLLGCALGLGILQAMASILASTRDGSAPIVFTLGQMLNALGVAVLLSLASSLIPILSTRKLALKDVILNIFEQVHRPGKVKTILGFILLIMALVLPHLANNATMLIFGLLSTFMLFGATIMLIPFITKVLVLVIEKVYGLVAGNIGLMAAKNLRENNSILNSVTLLSLGIATLLMINTLSSNVLELTTDVWGQNVTHDLSIQVPGADQAVVEEIEGMEGVQSVMPIYSMFNVGVADSHYNVSWLQGIYPANYLDFYTMEISQEVLDSLEQERNIVLANFMAKILEVKVGDTVLLETENGPQEYTVVGTVPVLFNNGNFGMIGANWLREDMQVTYYSEILANAQDYEVVAADLRNALNYRRAQVVTIASLQDANYRSNQQIFSIMQGFSILMMIIGIVGVINNLLVSFLQRKRHIAMLRSVGMSKGQVRTMIMWESLSGGIIGGTIGVVSGLLLLYVLPWLLEGMLLPMSITLSPTLILWSFLSGVIVMVFASVAPAFKSSGLEIIQAIKFE